MSTDLFFKEDTQNKKLYINMNQTAGNITIEYIPRLRDVSDIVEDHWIDMLSQLSLAYAKIAVGRIRSRYSQQGALWQGDGDSILAEGNSELTNLREKMRVAIDYTLPVD